ncbi:uncharacterized protein LAJ45_03677 [Morchella importuna]|uniref:uncharacterized protein n=1 Tax=Morchella importuna TaxID=1174673 RepID=UPI001E8CCDF6|nr:uncharacterized protein LAJ45_03677 [Morchella importuna]KAH8152251.1 hypothetical protein LAJ45_03677 [Morchella importuna]
MSLTSPAFKLHEMNILGGQIEVLKAELTHLNLFLGRYIRLLSRVHAESLDAVAGDAISRRNEGMAARILELTQTLVNKTQLLLSLDDRLVALLNENRSVKLH